MIGYDFAVDPRGGVDRLRRVEERASNLRPVFTTIREMMLKDQRRNFDSRGGVFGEKWPGSATMEKSGALAAAARGGKGRVARIGKATVKVGINKKIFYARFHQAGAPAGSRRGNLPRRVLVGIAPPTRRTSLTLISKYLSS